MIVDTVVNALRQDSTCAATFEDRVYPGEAPDAATYPFVVVSKAAGVGSYVLAGDTGIEDARVQVDVLDDRGYEKLIASKTAVRRALSGRTGGIESGDPCAILSSFCINDLDFPVSVTERSGPKVRRRLLEFRIWNREV